LVAAMMIMPVLPSNVHFRKQLVESRSSLPPNSSTTLTSDRVNFINEDQAGALSLLLNKSREAPTLRTFPRILIGDAKNGTPFSSDRFG